MAEVGLALSIVPIVLEALKQYTRLYKACKKFKKCKNGVEELLNCLQTQKVIFANETRLLFTNVLGSENAIVMINDVEHSLWQDTTIAARVEIYLGDSRDALISTGQDINRTMNRFADELKKLQFGDSSGNTTFGKEWRKEVRQRFTYVFTESKLSDVAQSISELTRSYRTLRLQLDELTVHKPDPENNSETMRASSNVLTTTQAAARCVYKVLATACRLHTKHHAHLSLKPQYKSAAVSTEIKFQIAYRHLSRQQTHGSSDALWFFVESVLFETIQTEPALLPTGIQTTTAKRSRSPSLVTIQKTVQEQKKRVKFRSPSPDAGPATSLPLRSSTITMAPPDLGTTSDFCTQLRACCKDERMNGKCIGSLRSSSQWKFRVYPSKGPKEQVVVMEAASLASPLASARKSSQTYQGLTLLQRLQLAKVVVTATLNFFATPWMQSSWRSEDIFLYDIESATMGSTTKEPEVYIEVPVDKQLDATSYQTPPALAPFVRNHILFNLAVILLELAFEKSIRDMIQPSDAKPGLPASTIEYYAAIRLSKEVSAYLGTQYSHIVEQCLFCAFGQGTELSNPALQRAVQREVVSELDRLASGFQQLLIG